MRDILIYVQNTGTSKAYLTIVIYFIFSKDLDEERVMHWKSDKKDITISDNWTNVFDELLESLLFLKYQNGLENERSDFIFGLVQLLNYKCHNVNFRRGVSHIEYVDWIKSKKETVNSENKDDKYIFYLVKVALNYEVIESHPDKNSNIRTFVNKYTSSKEIKYPSKIDGWKTLEENNPIIALNVLYIKDLEICSTYLSKFISDCKKQITPLIIKEKEESQIILQ